METVEIDGRRIGKWRVGASTFLAIPELGARLMNWNIAMADGSIRDIIHWPAATDWGNFAKVRGGNPVLFPFAGRSYFDGEVGFWKAPGGRRLPMPNHGFARNSLFDLLESNPVGFRARLVADEDASQTYPFRYAFDVAYNFQELCFQVDFILTNNDDIAIPWSPGHHFYFKLPWHAGCRRSDYRIQIPARKAFRPASDGSLVELKDFERETSMDHEALLERIHTRLKSPVIKLGPRSGEEDLELTMGGYGAGVPDAWASVVTWTEDASSPFYCVEPWMGPPNAAAHKHGLGWVEPGASSVWSVSVAFA